MAIQLIMKFEDGTSRSFDLQKDCTTIGSRRTCDLHVAIPSIAPLHCEIKIKDGKASLLNLDPEADTFHNDVMVSLAEISNDDKVRIGPVEFTIKMNDDETVIRRL
jgi:predicted component of type VI protein secretion system